MHFLKTVHFRELKKISQSSPKNKNDAKNSKNHLIAVYSFIIQSYFISSSPRPVHTERIELFNFKDPEGQKIFKRLTTNTTKLSQCFKGNSPFLKQSQKRFKTLNSFFYQGSQKSEVEKGNWLLLKLIYFWIEEKS